MARRPDWLGTSELRQSLVVELFRELSLLDFQTLSASPEWRTYIALHAAFMSLTDSELRRQVQTALGQSEREHLAKVAAAWEYLTGLLGYRLRPSLAATFVDLAALLDATMRGLIIMTAAVPELASKRLVGTLPGSVGSAELSLPAVGLAGIADAFVEPDPAVVWDADRIGAVRQQLVALDLPPG